MANYNPGHGVKSTDAEFLAPWHKTGSPSQIAQALGCDVRKVFARRRSIEKRYNIALVSNGPGSSPIEKERIRQIHHEGRIDVTIENGVCIVFSDAHYWPDLVTTAHRALLAMIRQLKPVVVINNGDAFDGASISRFPVMQWMEADRKPSVTTELDACKARLGEIEKEAGSAHLLWNLGNHDARYEAKLAASLSGADYGHIKGFHLKDHFPNWKPAWTTWINEKVLVCHRIRNGVHATHTNVQSAHCSTITGHLHSLKITPYTDARGHTKYGVDTGTLADPMGPQFIDYTEGKHSNWRSGFAVLTFRNGELLMPELVKVWDEDRVEFRGHLLDADTGEVV